MPINQPPVVLSFAAADPTCGAGIQADLMALCSQGVYPVSVVTALTVQDTEGVHAVLPIEAGWVENQASALLKDMTVSAFKLGLLGSIENIETVAGIIGKYPEIPVVLDPVLSSGRGDPLADEAAIDAIKALLIPHSTIITPNTLEAQRLVTPRSETAKRPTEQANCARQLIALGTRYVLLTGTHEDTTEVVNSLFDCNGLIRKDSWPRLPGSYHGSGCTLASALAARLAKRQPIETAVHEAQDYTWRALSAGFCPGKGQYLPDRFYWATQWPRQ